MAFGDHAKEAALHMVLRNWHLVLVDERALQQQAIEQAERERLKQIHDTRMKGVLLKMEGDNKSFVKECLFGCWRDMVEATKAGGSANAELQKQIAYYKALHSENVRKSMLMLCSSNDTSLVHAIVGVWKELIAD